MTTTNASSPRRRPRARPISAVLQMLGQLVEHAAGVGERLRGHPAPRFRQQLLAAAEPDLRLQLDRRVAEAPSEALVALGQEALHLLRLARLLGALDGGDEPR